MMYGYEDCTPRQRYDAILDNLDAMYEDLKQEIDEKEEQIQVLEQRVDRVLEESTIANVKLADQTQLTNLAYSQRAIAAVAFAHTVIALGGTAEVGKDSREDRLDCWRVVLYVDTPAGQLSWHIAPQDQPMLQGLPEYVGKWDEMYNSADVDFYKGFIK